MNINKLSDNSLAFINLIAKISERDKTILIERFRNHKSMIEVAKILKVTNARIQQVENSWLKRIDQVFEYANL